MDSQQSLAQQSRSQITEHAEAGPALVIHPVIRQPLHRQVAESLRALITQGKLQPGDALPPERRLATEFGVSRVTIREALRVLQLWGLVETRQGGGNFVCAPSLEHIVGPLATIIQHNRQMQDELLDARFIFEPSVCWLAAQRRTESDLAAIEAIVERQRGRVERGELAVEEDSAFHLALAEATHNRVVPPLIRAINDLLLESRLRSLRTPDRPRRSLEGHLRIVAALRASDADAARQAMGDHILEIGSVLRAARALPSEARAAEQEQSAARHDENAVPRAYAGDRSGPESHRTGGIGPNG